MTKMLINFRGYNKHELEQTEPHDLNSFLRGLRPNILQDMNDCKNIHEPYWEAIRVEHMLKRSRLRKAKCQEKRSLQTTKSIVVEPLAEDNKTDIAIQEQKPGNFMTISLSKVVLVLEDPGDSH